MSINKEQTTIINQNYNNNRFETNGIIYETKTFKVVIPQLFATLVAASYHVVVGMSFGFSGILIPEIEKVGSDINATTTDTSLIASAGSLTFGFGSILSGYIVDKLGRVNGLKFSTVPQVLGWVIVALSYNVTMIVCGRILIGFAQAISCLASGIYVSEISFPKLRGTMLTTMCVASSIGIKLVYLEGLALSWRVVAWICILHTSISTFFTFFIPESPYWLVDKNRNEEAKKSLKWLHRFHHSGNNNEEDISEIHFAIVRNEHNKRREIEKKKPKTSVFRNILKPSAYKPILILTGLCTVQQFSGFFPITAYAITFFQNLGSNISPLISSNIITIMPIIISILNLYTMSRYGRKTLLIVSCVGTTISLFVSGLFTKWIQDGSTKNHWVPVVFIFLFMAMEIVGIQPIPYDMMGEIFPFENRGFIVGIFGIILQLLMFMSIYSYRFLEENLGNYGIQFFYGTVSLVGCFYIYFFVPETHCKTLQMIEDDFK